MAGRLGLGRSLPYSRKRTLESVPTLKTKHLKGGVVYHDGQFDDARFGINLFQTCIEKGAVVLNYFKVDQLLKTNEKITGVVAVDQETGKRYELKAKVVINATGIFVDDIIQMDRPEAKNIVCTSQGVHLVLNKSFVPNEYAVMIPKTSDGRVLFAVPWHNKVVVGTTDVKKDKAELEPIALQQEVDFILETAGRFLAKKPQRSDVKSVFAGLRPLAAPSGEGKKTKEISRGHKIVINTSGLVSIIGGKWTTYRKMGEDVVNAASKIAKIPIIKSKTTHLQLHGWKENVNLNDPFYFYGSDADKMLALINDDKELGEYLSEELQIIKAQVVWAVRYEMARTVEDFLARRCRALLLDAKESLRIAPEVAKIMANELGYDATWIVNQQMKYEHLAKNYILN